MKRYVVPVLIVLAVILSLPAIYGGLLGGAPVSAPTRAPNTETPGQDPSVVLLVVVGAGLIYLWSQSEGMRRTVKALLAAALSAAMSGVRAPRAYRGDSSSAGRVRRYRDIDGFGS